MDSLVRQALALSPEWFHSVALNSWSFPLASCRTEAGRRFPFVSRFALRPSNYLLCPEPYPSETMSILQKLNTKLRRLMSR
jgi:hypothetical protein